MAALRAPPSPWLWATARPPTRSALGYTPDPGSRAPVSTGDRSQATRRGGTALVAWIQNPRWPPCPSPGLTAWALSSHSGPVHACQVCLSLGPVPAPALLTWTPWAGERLGSGDHSRWAGSPSVWPLSGQLPTPCASLLLQVSSGCLQGPVHAGTHQL